MKVKTSLKIKGQGSIPLSQPKKVKKKDKNLAILRSKLIVLYGGCGGWCAH